MKDLLLDIRYALRVLWKSPAFTLVALLTLMLSIGANVVVFGVMNAVLLHPMDVSDPQNLYQLRLKPWTHGKLLRQVMTEAVVLSMLGGAAGLVIASLLLNLLSRLGDSNNHLAVSVDGRVYLAAFAFTLVSALHGVKR